MNNKYTKYTKYTIVLTTNFKKQYKNIKKQGKDLNKLKTVVNKLANGEILEPRYKDHSLINDKYYKNCRECHIESDWLLIYQIDNGELELLLLAIGSHTKVFIKL